MSHSRHFFGVHASESAHTARYTRVPAPQKKEDRLNPGGVPEQATYFEWNNLLNA
jgi:hypothetical protein